MVGTHSAARIRRALSPGAIASCVVLAVGACSAPSRPQLLVAVESELTSLAEVRVRTLDEAGATIDMHTFDLSVTQVPFSFGIAARDGSRLGVHLQLDAHDDAGALVATRAVRTQMDPARRLVVVVRFTADCAPGPVCGEGETCIEGRCAPDWVDPRPDDDGGAPLDASMPAEDGGLDLDDAGVADGGVDAAAAPADGGVDAAAAPADGGTHTCPSETCACTGGQCTCASGATCAWSDPGSTTMVCDQGATCAYAGGASSAMRCARDAECSGELGQASELTCTRATCDVRLGHGSSALCDQRATCVIACDGHCTVDCRQARSCIVSCASGSPRDAAGTVAQCSG